MVEGKTKKKAVLEVEKKNGRLVGAAETSRELAEWHRLQYRSLNKLSLLKRNGWSQCHKVNTWQGCQSCFCQKEKEQRHQSRSPDCEMGESKGE